MNLGDFEESVFKLAERIIVIGAFWYAYFRTGSWIALVVALTLMYLISALMAQSSLKDDPDQTFPPGSVKSKLLKAFVFLSMTSLWYVVIISVQSIADSQ
jgi:hypothetical protein